MLWLLALTMLIKARAIKGLFPVILECVNEQRLHNCLIFLLGKWEVYTVLHPTHENFMEGEIKKAFKCLEIGKD